MTLPPQAVRTIAWCAALLTPLASAPRVAAQDTTALARIARLEARIAALEGQETSAPTIASADGRGFLLRSAAGVFQIRLRALLQSDSRLVAGSGAPASTTTFLLRRVRPIVEATTFGILDLRFVPDFGNGRAEVFDAHADLRWRPWLSLRTGKFKPPIALERLQGAADLLFVERGMPTNLAPQRDIGVQLGGEILGGTAAYAVGAFNGAFDLGTADADNGSEKDYSARLFVHPMRRRGGALAGLGFGLAGSHGHQTGTAAAPGLPAYRSAAQQTIFAYRANGTAAGTAIAIGLRRRLAPQAYWYRGRFGALTEFTRSSHDVALGGSRAALSHSAWQLSANYVIAGGTASHRAVAPTHAVGNGRGRGAFEIGVRRGRLDPDDAAFPTFADPAVAVQRADATGVVLTWHLAYSVKIMAHAESTAFRGGAPAGDRPAERAILFRVQHAY